MYVTAISEMELGEQQQMLKYHFLHYRICWVGLKDFYGSRGSSKHRSPQGQNLCARENFISDIRNTGSRGWGKPPLLLFSLYPPTTYPRTWAPPWEPHSRAWKLKPQLPNQGTKTKVGNGRGVLKNSWSHPSLQMHGSHPKHHTQTLRTELSDRAPLNS